MDFQSPFHDHSEPQPGHPLHQLLHPLSPREREVLRCFIATLCDKAVARELGTRSHTVRNQLAALMRKVGAQSREELVLLVTHVRLTGVRPRLPSEGPTPPPPEPEIGPSDRQNAHPA